MQFTSVCAVAGLLGLAYAAPNDAEGLFARQRPTCNRDNCFRQVAATSARPGSASASRDCASILLATVVPCTVTFTSFAPTSTATVTATQTSTTDYTAATITPDPVTQTATETATETATVTQGSAKHRRVPAVMEAAGEPEIRWMKRVVAATACTTATTVRNSAVPTYASSCRSPAQYSSACSCNGVTGAATTLAAPSTTITSTPSTTVTVTTTAVVSNPLTETAATPTSSVTVTTTSTTTTTVAPASNTCPPSGNILEGCNDNTVCSASQVCRIVSYDECDSLCANDPNCFAYSYDNNNQNCVTYSDCCNGN